MAYGSWGARRSMPRTQGGFWNRRRRMADRLRGEGRGRGIGPPEALTETASAYERMTPVSNVQNQAQRFPGPVDPRLMADQRAEALRTGTRSRGFFPQEGVETATAGGMGRRERFIQERRQMGRPAAPGMGQEYEAPRSAIGGRHLTGQERIARERPGMNNYAPATAGGLYGGQRRRKKMSQANALRRRPRSYRAEARSPYGGVSAVSHSQGVRY